MAKPNNIEAGPHPAVATIVEWLIPEYHQEYVIGDLWSQRLSSWRYFWRGLDWLAFIVTRQIWPAFSLRLLTAEAAALAAAFAGAPFDQGFLIALSAGLLGLVLRDAYVYPKQGSPIHQGVDTMVALVFLLGVESFEVMFAAHHALPDWIMLRGLALALLTVSMVRVILRRPQRGQPLGTASYRMTRFMTGLWMGAAMLVMFVNHSFTPEFIPHQDLWHASLPILAFGVAYRLQKNAIDGSLTGGLTALFQEDVLRLARKRDQLWVAPVTKASEFPWHVFFEVLAFVLFGLPPAVTLLSWLVGHTPSSAMDWFAVLTNTGSVLALSVLWIRIRKANADSARELEEDMEKRKGL